MSVLPLTALGVPVDLRFHGRRADEAYDAFAPRWRLCARAFGTAERAVDVTLGTDLSAAVDEPVVGSTDLGQLLQVTTQKVTHHAIGGNIGRLLMFHAAAVCNPVTGTSLVAVAPGGTGKTTVCRTLGPGRGYLSDETVGVREDGTIVPYPKPLSVRRSGAATKEETDPRSVGLAPPRVTPYVEGLVVLARDDRHRGAARVEPLDLFDAIIGVTPETSSLSRLTRPLHRLENLLVRLPLLARVHYAEAATLEPVVTELIGAPA